MPLTQKIGRMVTVKCEECGTGGQQFTTLSLREYVAEFLSSGWKIVRHRKGNGPDTVICKGCIAKAKSARAAHKQKLADLRTERDATLARYEEARRRILDGGKASTDPKEE